VRPGREEEEERGRMGRQTKKRKEGGVRKRRASYV